MSRWVVANLVLLASMQNILGYLIIIIILIIINAPASRRRRVKVEAVAPEPR